eukprot:tig00021319_g20221.t1
MKAPLEERLRELYQPAPLKPQYHPRTQEFSKTFTGVYKDTTLDGATKKKTLVEKHDERLMRGLEMRGDKGRALVEKARRAEEELAHRRRLAYERKREATAVRIQAWWRGCLGRRRARWQREVLLLRAMDEAAVLLQSVYRMRLAKLIALQKRGEEERVRGTAAKMIQHWYRGLRAVSAAREHLDRLRSWKDHAAAVKIQALARRRLARRALARCREWNVHRRENEAARAVQSVWRAEQAKRLVAALLGRRVDGLAARSAIGYVATHGSVGGVHARPAPPPSAAGAPERSRAGLAPSPSSALAQAVASATDGMPRPFISLLNRLKPGSAPGSLAGVPPAAPRPASPSPPAPPPPPSPAPPASASASSRSSPLRPPERCSRRRTPRSPAS